MRPNASLPVRGAWIEMRWTTLYKDKNGSLPVRGAWIEIFIIRIASKNIFESLPVRGAWIEISQSHTDTAAALVAPRAGSVD